MKESEVEVHAYNPWVQGQPGLHSKTLSLKKKLKLFSSTVAVWELQVILAEQHWILSKWIGFVVS